MGNIATRKELKQERLIDKILKLVLVSQRPQVIKMIGEICELERELTLMEEDPN